MAKEIESKSTESKNSDIAAVQAKELLARAREAAKITRGAQQVAREVLGDGMSEVAKACRLFVAKQGTDAPERTAELVAAILDLVRSK